jgi:tight adherence protein B
VTALVLSAVLAVGVYLLYDGVTRPAAVESAPRRWRSVEEFLLRAGLPGVTPKDFVLFSLASGAVAAAAAQLLLGWGLVSVLGGGLGLVAPFTYYARRHARRRAAVQAGLVDALTQLRDAIRTGFSVPEALGVLAESGPDALRPEFARLVAELRVFGMEEALGRARERVADPVFDMVAASLALNDRLGGRHVSQVLDRLAHATRAQLRVTDELRAVQARNVLSARIVAAVPLLLLVGTRQVSPAYLSVFDSWEGQLLLAASVLSVAVGYAAMLWTVRLPGERRVLR